MPPTKTWKAVERKVASIIGGQRVGNRGRHSEAEDVEHPTFSVEVKHRQRLPATLVEWYKQAQDNAPPGKTPLVVVHEHGGREFFAILSLVDLARLVREAVDDLVGSGGGAGGGDSYVSAGDGAAGGPARV